MASPLKIDGVSVDPAMADTAQPGTGTVTRQTHPTSAGTEGRHAEPGARSYSASARSKSSRNSGGTISAGKMSTVDMQQALDRGDAPALAALHKNQFARFARHADETKMELGKIADRVDQTLHFYENPAKMNAAGAPTTPGKTPTAGTDAASLEFVDDVTQLMMILSDPLAKRKYQQYVTIFVVGYENLCVNRLQLLTQINQFFADHSRAEDIPEIEYPEFDIDVVGRGVQAAIEKAQKTRDKLDIVSQEVVSVLDMLNPNNSKSKKKKIEKALQDSKQQAALLTEKLIIAQSDSTDATKKYDQVYKNMEIKSIEIERMKIVMEGMKKRLIEEPEAHRVEIDKKNQELQKIRQEVTDLNLQVGLLEEKVDKEEEKEKERKELEILKFDYEQKTELLQKKLVDTRKMLEEKQEAEAVEMKANFEILLQKKAADENERLATLNGELTQLRLTVVTHEEREAAAEAAAAEEKFAVATPKERSRAPSPSNMKTAAILMRKALQERELEKQREIERLAAEAAAKEAVMPIADLMAMLPPKDVSVQTDPIEPEIQYITKTPEEIIQAVVDDVELDSRLTSQNFDEMKLQYNELTEKYTKSAQALKHLAEFRSNLEQEIEEWKAKLAQMTEQKIDAKKESDMLLMQLEAMDVTIGENQRAKLMEERKRTRSVPAIKLTSIPVIESDSDSETESKKPASIATSKKTSVAGSKKKMSVAGSKRKSSIAGSKKQLSEVGSKKLSTEIPPHEVIIIEHPPPGEDADEVAESVHSDKSSMRGSLFERHMSAATVTSARVRSAVLGDVVRPLVKEMSGCQQELLGLRDEFASRLHGEGLFDEEDMLRTLELEEVIEDGDDPVADIKGIINNNILITSTLQSLLPILFAALEEEDEEIVYDGNESPPVEPAASSLAPEPLEELHERPASISSITTSADVTTPDDVAEPSPCVEEEQAGDRFDAGATPVTSVQITQTIDHLKVVQPRSCQTSPRGSAISNGRSRLVNDYKELIQKHSELERQYGDLDRHKAEQVRDHEVEINKNAETIHDLEASIASLQQQYDLIQLEHARIVEERPLAPDPSKKKQRPGKRVKILENPPTPDMDLISEDGLPEKPLETRPTLEDERSVKSSDTLSSLSGPASQGLDSEQHAELPADMPQQNMLEYMFTRTDIEYNTHALQRGMARGRVSPNTVQEASAPMKQYSDIPGKQLSQLVWRYVHFRNMKDTEKRLVDPQLETKELSVLLDKLEFLQQKRSMTSDMKQREMSRQRQRLATLLIKRLREVETRTGIFLIKPIRTVPRSHHSNVEAAAYEPAPAPLEKSSKVNKRKYHSYGKLMKHLKQTHVPSIQATHRMRNNSAATELSGSGLVPSSELAYPVWQPPASFIPMQSIPAAQADIIRSDLLMRMPKLLEMDINRTLFPTNQISVSVKPISEANEKDQQQKLISYMTVSRPVDNSNPIDSSFLDDESGLPMVDVPFSLVHDRSHQVASAHTNPRSVSTLYSNAERLITPTIDHSPLSSRAVLISSNADPR